MWPFGKLRCPVCGERSESEARLPEDLKFLRDERSLGFIQRRALFSL